MSIMPLHDDSGLVSHFVAIERDVTHWHSVQDALYLLAVTDELTGLSNRRLFAELGNKYLHLAHRQATPLSVVMLDLDYFKQVNDRFGHQMGDSLLRVVGRVLSQGIRESDVAGRLGGEEFGLLLPETSQHEALQVIHRVQAMLDGACQAASLPPAACVTLSVGLTLLRAEDKALDDILQRADEALYTAKKLGRNRVEISFSGGAPSFPGPCPMRSCLPVLQCQIVTTQGLGYAGKRGFIPLSWLFLLPIPHHKRRIRLRLSQRHGRNRVLIWQICAALAGTGETSPVAGPVIVAADMVVGLFAVFGGLRQAGPSLVAAGRFLPGAGHAAGLVLLARLAAGPESGSGMVIAAACGAGAGHGCRADAGGLAGRAISCARSSWSRHFTA
jgi:diguanylate cyclase (GGDEF)-like protein